MDPKAPPNRAPAPLTMLEWRDADPPTPDSVARRLRAEGVEPYAWSNGPGDRYPVHAHAYEKLLMCAAGSITFFGPEQTAIELAPGSGFVLTAGVEHSAVVGPSGCTCLEGHREEGRRRAYASLRAGRPLP